MHTMANSEDPDEMPHNAAFLQGLHCLLTQQEGHSGPESLTSLYYEHQSYKLMRPQGKPIFGPRGIIWTNLVEIH